MCYTGLCYWENINGECSCISNKNCCPKPMLEACQCGEEFMQLQDDDKYYCISCGNEVEI